MRGPRSTRRLPQALGVLCLLATVWILSVYPLPVWTLATALAIYATALWRRPHLFLLVVPAVVPALDLGLWTGWQMAGESDLFLLVTTGVLLLAAPPTLADLGLPRPAAIAVIAIAATWSISAAMGLASSYGAPPSDNAFLRPDNAVRIGKSLAEALVLLPFICQRQRIHGDAVTKLGWGFSIGLVVVTLIVIAERILFADFLDFSTEYRVAGPFSSMRVGGGHIGAYAALALPFALTWFRRRPRWQGEAAALLICLCGAYTVAVTFARTAYAACAAAMIVAGLGWLWAANARKPGSALVGATPVLLVLAGLAAAAGLTGMQTRLAASGTDLATRRDNWAAGLAVRDQGIVPALMGMGLGSYQRIMAMRSPINRPSDLALRRDETGSFVEMRLSSPFFLGQKIEVPTIGSMHLALRFRSSTGSKLGIAVCDKVLLYSDHCTGADAPAPNRDQWSSFTATLAPVGLGQQALGGLLRRPVEFSIFGQSGDVLSVRDIVLTDDAGRSLIANGTFVHGLDRWIFTDDSHVSWRMLNEYLMLFFETGILGLLAYLGLAAAALFGATRAIRAGAIEGSAIAGSVTSFMVSGLFDNVLEAPRLALLFFLVCWCGLIQPRLASPAQQLRH